MIKSVMPTADERLPYRYALQGDQSTESTSPPESTVDSEVLSERMFVSLDLFSFSFSFFFFSFFFAFLCIMTGPTSPILGSLALLGGLSSKGPDFRLTFLNTPFSLSYL